MCCVARVCDCVCVVLIRSQAAVPEGTEEEREEGKEEENMEGIIRDNKREEERRERIKDEIGRSTISRFTTLNLSYNHY